MDSFVRHPGIFYVKYVSFVLCICYLLQILDEFNVDYSKLVKPAAVEGLRVEDLVKQYFEAAEQVCKH